MIKDLVFWGWRWLVCLAIVGFAVAFLGETVVSWRGDVELNRHGSVAEVPIVAVHGQGRHTTVYVRMPNGDVDEIDARPGMHVGGWVDVVYRVDDMDDVETPGAPSDGTVGDLFAGLTILMVGGMAVWGLLVRPYRNIPGRFGQWHDPYAPFYTSSRTPPPASQRDARARRANRADRAGRAKPVSRADRVAKVSRVVKRRH